MVQTLLLWHYHEKLLDIATYVTMGADDFEKGVQMHTLRNMIARITTRQPSSPSDTQNLHIKRVIILYICVDV